MGNKYEIGILKTFSIKDMEAFTGVKCHTIRIWEQRYKIVVPKRTSGNIRYYDESDLKHLLNIVTLNNNGKRISEIARLDRETLNRMVMSLNVPSQDYISQRHQLSTAMLAYDETAFHKHLTTMILQFGLEETMMKIVLPFLTDVGMLWQVGSIDASHEHFVSNIIEQKLYVAIDGQIGRLAPNHKKFLLFLPDNEQHNLGLLFANYIFRSRGNDVLFLGKEVPVSDLQTGFGSFYPDFMFTSITSAQMSNLQVFIDELCKKWPKTTLLLTGYQVLNTPLQLPENARIIRTIEDLIQFANSINPSN